jgi:putative PIG3 family NAD(P)H quinone oxidoreductase
MLAIEAATTGGPDVLRLVEAPDPVLRSGEVLIGVAATAVNRADLHQRQGGYPPPKGTSEILGLECSGTVLAHGSDVDAALWPLGTPVCALLAGGGYAEKVAVPVGQLMPVPDGVDLLDAAALPEVLATVWSNLVMTARLSPGETVLVHGGAGGIGTAAIQVAVALKATVVATAGSPEKVARCRELGASVVINYREQDFVDVLRTETGGAGADVILDVMGGSYLVDNVRALAVGGRLVVIGLQGGLRGQLDLGALLTKRGIVTATSLRPRPLAEKAEICRRVVDQVWPMIAAGRVRPVITARFPLAEAACAHVLLESGDSSGKVLLTVDRP